MVSDMEVDKVADMVADNKKEFTSILTWKSKLVREKVNWAKTFRPKAYPACASSMPCEFIMNIQRFTCSLVGTVHAVLT